jgi:hypothetical protein
MQTPARERHPHLLPLFFSAVVAAVFGVVAIAQTDSWWVAGATVGALILLVLAIVLDVSRSVENEASGNRAGGAVHAAPAGAPGGDGLDFRGPDAPDRLLVVTSEPVPAERVLDAVARQTESAPSRSKLGVMVVSPKGFGGREITNNEDHYEDARRAEGETVASLRQGSVKAAGHVGDHDAAQAVADALVLFPADRVLVFAHPRYAAAYRAAFDSHAAGRPVSIVDVGA